MATRASSSLTWLLVVATVMAMMVTNNVKICRADAPASEPPSSLDKIDMGQVVDKVKDKASGAKDSLSNWFSKISGGEKMSTGDMKEGAENMMHKAKDSATEASQYVSDEAKAAKGEAGEMYDGAKQKVGAAYDSTKSGAKSASEKVEKKCEGAKEKATSQ